MKALARLFSVLTLIAILGAGAALIWLRPLPPARDLPPLSGQIDRILVEKAARRMTIFRDGQALRSYRVALGFTPVGPKTRQGDGRTPEGIFQIDRRNDASSYHLSLGINYPRPQDITLAEVGGYAAGGDIFFHGQPNAFKGKATLRSDWTAGCIALSDTEIEQLWDVTPIGTEVEIRP
ncbi:MAG: L,D-transpeptidase [Paracoccaceae bacterium]